VEGKELAGHRGDGDTIAMGGDAGTAAHAEHEGREGGDAHGGGKCGAGIVGAGDENFGATAVSEVDAAVGGGGELRLGGVGEFGGGEGGSERGEEKGGEGEPAEGHEGSRLAGRTASRAKITGRAAKKRRGLRAAPGVENEERLRERGRMGSAVQVVV